MPPAVSAKMPTTWRYSAWCRLARGPSPGCNLLELQRDWARTETYDVVTGIAKEHGGGYGLGIIYAKEMFNAKEGQ